VPISAAKYPAITPEEEQMSIPLSAVCVAIFDAILLDLMVSTEIDWEPIRRNMCLNLNDQKNPRTATILENDKSGYGSNLDVVFLQESSQAFVDLANGRKLGQELFDIYLPSNLDSSRDQNSVILLKKGHWTNVIDVSPTVSNLFQENLGLAGNPTAPGDLAVFVATRNLDKNVYVLASFHGDTNGVATKPVVDVVHSYVQEKQQGASFLFGLDANVHFDSSNPTKLAYVGDFLQNIHSHDMNSCYGLNPEALEYTTFNARTYLQPQLNKAVRADQRDTSPNVDKNPKDFILFYEHDFKASTPTFKDNTGDGTFIRGIVFPTFDFPSDHAISSFTLVSNNIDNDNNNDPVL